ncbi:MAG: hypothetical protein JSS32_09590 [Verrucomicrobia bacterium]|nr:hypothetical protein [Verrucomicrobiota bacterium]
MTVILNNIYRKVTDGVTQHPVASKITLGCGLAALGVYAPLTATAAAGAFALAQCVQSCLKPKEDHPFPFYTIQLPSFNFWNKNTWFEKTGLKLEEAKSLDKYISAHRKDWQSSLKTGEVLRIPKEESGLPRTIHVYREYGRLCVQVCCKTKNGLKAVGRGGFKSAKMAVEWMTKTLWVQSTAKDASDFDRIGRGLVIQDQFHDVRGVFPSPKGRLVFDSNGIQKFSMFAPLRDGCLRDHFDVAVKYKFTAINDVLNALKAFEERNITHGDLMQGPATKEDNVLFYIDGGKACFEIADFDVAAWRSDIKKCREDSKNNSQDSYFYNSRTFDLLFAKEFISKVLCAERINDISIVGFYMSSRNPFTADEIFMKFQTSISESSMTIRQGLC